MAQTDATAASVSSDDGSGDEQVPLGQEQCRIEQAQQRGRARGRDVTASHAEGADSEQRQQ